VSVQGRLQPDLIAASALQPHLDQGRVCKRLDRAIAGNRSRTARVARVRCLLDERFLVPLEDVAPCALRRLRMAIDDGEVNTVGGARLELGLQVRLRVRRSREEHEPGRILIDPMDNERLALGVRAEPLDDLPVHGRHARMPVQRHGKDSRRLVDDDQVFVLVDHVEVSGPPDR
jgi:hypothetical protein